MSLNKLSDMGLRQLSKVGKHFDGGGLYLEITAAGGHYWRLKYRFADKEKRLAFGVYPEVSLKVARERRDEARTLLHQGVDPAVVKKQEKARLRHGAEHTFRVVAGLWMDHQAARWISDTREGIRVSLETHVYPTLGDLPIMAIRPHTVIATILAVEGQGKDETAGRVLQRVRAVFRYAAVRQIIQSNPLVDVVPREILKPRRVRHRASMAEADLPKFLADFDAYQGEPTTKAALRLPMLTALRPGELRGLRWTEVGEREIRIPAERMKMKAPHIVPLSRQAVAVLKDAHKISGDRDLVFPSPFYPGQALSENTLNSALSLMGYKGKHTAHGFRSLFSTIANEHGKDADVIERQLAHTHQNEVRAAYHRAQYLIERHALMQWWADRSTPAAGHRSEAQRQVGLCRMEIGPGYPLRGEENQRESAARRGRR
jgi:integrase